MDRSRLTRLNLNAPNIMKWKLWRAASALHSPYYGSLWEWRRHRVSNQSFCATRAAGCTPHSKHVSLLMYVRTSHFWLLWIRVLLQIMREWVSCTSGVRQPPVKKSYVFFSCGQKFDSCRSIWHSSRKLAHFTVKIDTKFAAIYYLPLTMVFSNRWLLNSLMSFDSTEKSIFWLFQRRSIVNIINFNFFNFNRIFIFYSLRIYIGLLK